MGGAGADGCPELQLRNVMGRQCRSREVVPHRSLAGDSMAACLQLQGARRAEDGPAAPGETGGTITTTEARSGGPGTESDAPFGDGGGDRRGPGLGHSGGDAALRGAAICSNDGGAVLL